MGERLNPLPRREIIKRFKELGWSGPHPGAKHAVMYKDGLPLTIPNPHRGDISKALVGDLLREAGISRAEWCTC